MITNYRQAWVEFRKSKEYLELREGLKKYGIKQRYADIIMKVAFVAGWGDREIKAIKQ